MNRGIAVFLAVMLLFSYAGVAEPSAQAEEWMIMETLDLAKRIQALAQDAAYGRMFTSNEQLLAVGDTAAQMTIPEVSNANVIYVDLASFMQYVGSGVELSEEAGHVLNAQLGSTILQMMLSSYGSVALAGGSIYNASEVYPGFDVFSNAVVLLDCGTATIGAAFSMTDNGVVAANARLLPQGALNPQLQIDMPGVQTQSRIIRPSGGKNWHMDAALDAAARLKTLMMDEMYLQAMNASDEVRTVLDNYTAEGDSGMECVREFIPPKALLSQISFASEAQKMYITENFASILPTVLLSRKGAVPLSAGSMVNETLYYTDFPDFESRVVFVNAETFLAAVSFTSVGKGVVRVTAMPMPADTLDGFDETAFSELLGIAG